jgi:methyl-accepting chemotaxis protein
LSRRRRGRASRVQVGPDLLDLIVSAVYDADRSYEGALVTWEIVTGKERAERENAVWKAACEDTATSWLSTDPGGVVRYINPAMAKTLKKIEHALPLIVTLDRLPDLSVH